MARDFGIIQRDSPEKEKIINLDIVLFLKKKMSWKKYLNYRKILT